MFSVYFDCVHACTWHGCYLYTHTHVATVATDWLYDLSQPTQSIYIECYYSCHDVAISCISVSPSKFTFASWSTCMQSHPMYVGS